MNGTTYIDERGKDQWYYVTEILDERKRPKRVRGIPFPLEPADIVDSVEGQGK